MKRIIIAMYLAFMSLSSMANVPIENEYKKLVDIFFGAVRVGHVGVINEFLVHGFPIDQRNNQSYTPLMVAAYNGQSKIVEILINKGADVCAKDKRGNTAIMGALFKGELSIVKTLYAVKCNPAEKNNAGQTLEDFSKMFGKNEFLLELNS